MSYRVSSLAASLACIATLSLSACGGGDDQAASNVAPSTVSATSSAAMSPSSTSQSSTASAPGASGRPTASTTTTVTRTVAPSTTSKPAAPSGGHTIAPPDQTLADTISANPSFDNGTTMGECGDQIKVNGYTSCEFARAVVDTWRGHTAMSGVIYVKSPTTGDTYGLRCSSGARGSSCVTAKNAYVWAPI